MWTVIVQQRDPRHQRRFTVAHVSGHCAWLFTGPNGPANQSTVAGMVADRLFKDFDHVCR